MNHRILLVAALLCAAPSIAQHALITDHGFGATPEVTAEVKAMPDNIVLLRRTLVMDLEEEGEDMVEYFLLHNSVFLRDAGAIEAENKVHANLNGVIDVVKVEARSIAPDGTVHKLAEEDFKRAEDEDGTGSYLYFAFEGLVPGSVVDYFYVFKRSPNMKGDGEALQVGAPIIKEDVHLLNPARLVYKAKGYSGVPEPTIDTTETEIQHMRWDLKNVPGLENEPSANMGEATMRIAYKLDRVPDRGIKDYSSYLNATKLYHNLIHQNLEPKPKKEVAALVKKMALPKGASEEEKVRLAEDYIKNNYQLVESSAPELMLLESVLKNKACGDVGAMALTTAVLRELGVDYQVVVTSDRMRTPFDKDFESYQFLQEMALFLPSLNKYMDPTSQGLRLGYIPGECMDNYGLFIRNFAVGETLTGVGSVKYIDPLPDNATVHDHIITATLSPEADKCDLAFENYQTGYYASIQCFYHLLDDEKKKEVQQELVSYLLENGTVNELEAINGERKLFGVEPFIIKGKVETRKFSASAGEKMLFKVGELIGPQVEMYAEKPRKLPVDDDYNRQFNRTIDIVIPAGWTVQNLADFTIDKHLDLDGKRQLNFTCAATLEGNVLKLKIEEYYRVSRIPLEHFEGYRTVVNAAADFNKLAVVLVKG
ncbi:MAG: DUF3857 domain-containing protein [Flavobacteriales bacterium]|nr:DUF3857 domain-containing protein [Flavobacteriales bacterium]